MRSPVDVPVERDRLDSEIELDSTEGHGGTTYMQPRRQPPFWLVLLVAILAGIFAARWLESAAPEVVLGEDVQATEITEPVLEAEERIEVVEVVEEVEAPIDEPEEPAEDEDDEWNAEAEWEGELAYRVFSGQGAFDVEEIDIEAEPQPTTSPESPRELVRVEAVRSEEEAVADTQELEMVADTHEPEAVDPPSVEDPDPLADLPRQALFDKAKELGVPMKDLIVMDREELIEAIHRAELAHSR